VPRRTNEEGLDQIHVAGLRRGHGKAIGRFKDTCVFQEPAVIYGKWNPGCSKLNWRVASEAAMRGFRLRPARFL
jgi:hypothetical protein